MKEFAMKRSEFLKQFLVKTSQIYWTDLFYSRFEIAARANIQWEIEYLKRTSSSSPSGALFWSIYCQYFQIRRHLFIPFLLPFLSLALIRSSDSDS